MDTGVSAPDVTDATASRPPADEALEREQQASDRPWLHCSTTGEPLGPAPITMDGVTGRLIVTWEEGQTIAFEGRAILPQLGMKLFLGDLVSVNDSTDIRGSAPVTPPTARQQMITKARTQAEAMRFTAEASAADLNGSGTPPGAFEADDAVTLFESKWLYMIAGFGIPSPHPVGDTVPRRLPHHGPNSQGTAVAVSNPKSHSPTHGLSRHNKYAAQTYVSCPPTVVYTSPQGLRPLPPATSTRVPRHLIGVHAPHLLTLDIRSVCPFPGRRLPDIHAWRRGSLRSTEVHLHSSSCGQRTPVQSASSPGQRGLLWHIPTLLRNRAHQIHPWTRQARRRRSVQARRTSSRAVQGTRKYRYDTALLPCVAAYTMLNLLEAIHTVVCTVLKDWTHAYVEYPTSRPEAHFLVSCRFILQHHRYTQVGKLLEHIAQTVTAPECHRALPTISTPSDRTVNARDMHTLTSAHSSQPIAPTSKRGPPGPKSGERSRITPARPTWPGRMVVWLIQIQISAGTLDARVVTSAQGVTGAGLDPSTEAIRVPAKPSLGTQATHASHPRSSTRVHKRTFARALRRAQLNGGAWYRGKWIRPDPRIPFIAQNTREHVRARTPAQGSSRHYRVLSWNTGGLGGGLYDELLLYLQRSDFDVILLQETKWRFESMWENATYYFIHSGTNAKDHNQAGLLTIISKRVVDKGSLRYISAIDGRLMRVQFKHGPRQVDVINFYQHTWRPTKHVQSLRHKAWDLLTQHIQAVPLRSRLLIGGDFNTPCTASSPHGGPNVLPKPDHGIQDADDLQAIIQGLDLVT